MSDISNPGAEKTYLCFDLGTTKIKSALLDSNGKILHLSSKTSKSYRDGLSVFQKPEDYYDAVNGEIKVIAKKLGNKLKYVDSIMISGQMAGVLGIDKDWQVVQPWIYSIDTRANTFLDEIERKYGGLVRKFSGGLPFMASRIKWMKETSSGDYKKICKFINLTTYVAGRLANLKASDAFIDYSVLAMNGLADIQGNCWNSSLIKKLDLDEKKLPDMQAPFKVVGYVDKDVFKTNNNIKVLAGIGDQIAGFIGAGILNKNNLVDVAGTYTVIGYCNDTFIPDTRNRMISSIYTGIEDIYFQLGVAAVGGYLHQWFLDTFSYDNKKTKFVETDGLYIIPHIGGRSTPSQPYYQGTFYGLKWHHDLNSMYIAMLESIGYEYYHLSEELKRLNKMERGFTGPVRVIGGGSRNTIWNEIKSSIMGLDYLVLKDMPFEILGCFLIARYGQNVRKGFEEIEKKGTIPVVDKIKPSKDRIRYYNNYKNEYMRIVNKIGKVYFNNSSA